MNANCPFRPLLFSVDWREIHTRVPYKKGIPYGGAEKVKASIRKCLWWPKSGLVELRDFQRRENVWISYDREFTFSFFFSYSHFGMLLPIKFFVILLLTVIFVQLFTIWFLQSLPDRDFCFCSWSWYSWIDFRLGF